MKRLLLKSSLSAFVACLLLWSCMGQYRETKRVLPMAPFSSIQIQSVFTIYLVQDTIYSVEIVADEATINQIDTHVNADVLFLIDNNKQKWLKPQNNKVSVYIHSPSFNGIDAETSYSLYSTNTIKTDAFGIVNEGAVKLCDIDLDIDCNNFYYWNNYLSGGKLTLTGKCWNFEINNYGLHLVNTLGLRAQFGLIKNYSKADSKVYVTDTLTCDLNGTGNIYVYGNPALIVVNERTSSGQVIRVN